MSDPNNEEKITTKQVVDNTKRVIKYTYSIKCKECGEEFTSERIQQFGDSGYIGEDEEYHRGLREKLRDHKEKVHQIFEEGRTNVKLHSLIIVVNNLVDTTMKST